jgi:uncharacterized protein YdhG (YjbR/CyaY superfamily)
MPPTFADVDAYLASLPTDTRVVVEELRRRLLAVAPPEAVEAITYQIPTIKLDGKNLVHYAGWRHHVSVYPVPAGDEALLTELARYADGKGTLKFPLAEPIPYELIERAAAALIDERV